MLRLIRQLDFALLWFAGLVSLTGDWMLLVALPMTVYQLTDSAVATSGTAHLENHPPTPGAADRH